MPQSICIEQIEGYIRNTPGTMFALSDDGEAIVVPVATKHFHTRDGEPLCPVTVTVTHTPCAVVFTAQNVVHPPRYIEGNRFPKKVGHRSSGLRPLPYAVRAVLTNNRTQVDLEMVVPAVGPSVTGLEFAEAMCAFRDVVDRWAIRCRHHQGPLCDDPMEGPADDP
jgi:hypothetical protein